MWCFAIGGILLVPGVYTSFFARLTSEELQSAITPLARMPLDELRRNGKADLRVSIPDTKQWAEFGRKLGDPGYVIVAVSSAKQIVYCFERLAISIEVLRNGIPIETRIATGAPYGWSTDCRNSGLQFLADPGSSLEIKAAYNPQAGEIPAGDLTVLPFRRSEFKDHLVGAELDREIAAFSRVATPLGLALLVLGGFNYVFQRRRAS